MQIRSNVLPKCFSDWLTTLFTLVAIPFVFYFELFVVLPYFYTLWSPIYIFHFATGTFILFNICANYIALIMCETSIKGVILPAEGGPKWRYCSVCECLAPPRSWHCKTCGICILKRDHHCMFSACCVGYFNLRYFMVFVFYIFVATIYASYYNIFFIWETVDLWNYNSWAKLIFPLAALFIRYTTEQLHLLVVMLLLLATVFTGVLLYFHGNLVLQGMVTPEKGFNIRKYNRGIRKNVEEALGLAWKWVWLTPWLQSPLPGDGVHWDTEKAN